MTSNLYTLSVAVQHYKLSSNGGGNNNNNNHHNHQTKWKFEKATDKLHKKSFVASCNVMQTCGEHQ